jgi:type VI secretion system protein ImpH
VVSASGRDTPSLSAQLFERAEGFEFEQAVRLLARLFPARAPVGGDADPRDELVRFHSDLAPVFPTSDVRGALPAGEREPARLEVRFLGVATPASLGSLPRRYADEIRALVREKNPALRDFLDLFNHRLISLFFRARERHCPAVLFERGSDNPLERALAAVLGLGTRGLASRLALPDRALFARAGLLARRPLSAVALRGLLQSVFGVRAQIEQFRPLRCAVEPEDRTRLGRANARLGRDCIVGSAVELFDSKFRVRLGPLDGAQYEAFLPSSIGFRQLCELVRFATQGTLEFDVQLELEHADAPHARLGGDAVAQGRLGWSAWLGSRPGGAPLADAVLAARRARASGSSGTSTPSGPRSANREEAAA